MRKGITRSVLRAEVYLEAGYPTLAAQTVQMDPIVNQMLNRMERQLALKHSWVMRTFEVEKTVNADVQFADMPATLTDFTMVNEVWCLFGTQWLPVTYGIGAAERSLFTADMRSTPIQRWEWYTKDPTPEVPSFEVWPIPGQAQVLRFVGEEAAGLMANDSAVCVLDADALVQAVAGELIAKKNPEEAKLRLANADSIIRSLMIRQKSRKQANYNMAARPAEVLRPGIDFIPPVA